MYKLRDLVADLEEAKTGFRQEIANQNRKTYIYTFCEHIATLFAKLSNIRMSHEIYGFKHPHRQWEGILALDIWYQLLYKNIDAQYQFDDKFIDMNPMARCRILDGKVEWKGELKSRDDMENLGLEWIDDEGDSDHAYIWDNNLWENFNDNAKRISTSRQSCTTPRDVLKKIREIVDDIDGHDTAVALLNDITSGFSEDSPDFTWFQQPGKVYSDQSKAVFSKYTNLHLGRAYEVMTPYEWHELTDNDVVDGQYVKPTWDVVPHQKKEVMMNHGFQALQDAIRVLKCNGVFNIYNSADGEIEEFDKNGPGKYSQGQCAIVIERVFSMLYKYLQFKSTTSETFQRHINIDSGYKYLDTETILGSDNEASGVYFYGGDEVKYLRYLDKLKGYKNFRGLTSDEKAVLSKFIDILTKNLTWDWRMENWNLCPLCQSNIPSSS